MLYMLYITYIYVIYVILIIKDIHHDWYIPTVSPAAALLGLDRLAQCGHSEGPELQGFRQHAWHGSLGILPGLVMTFKKSY